MSYEHHVRVEQQQFYKLAPEAAAPIRALSEAAAKFGLERDLLELMKLRASQINGCAFCVQYHILIAQKLEVAPEKLNQVVAWRDAPVFSARERAALAWTEALTEITKGVSNDVYKFAREQFSEQELAYLTTAVAAINVWNRLSVAYHFTPPTQVP